MASTTITPTHPTHGKLPAASLPLNADRKTKTTKTKTTKTKTTKTKTNPNDPCPSCASGKKYKRCCREKDQEALFIVNQLRRTPYVSTQNDCAQECIRVACAWLPSSYSWMDISDQLTQSNYIAYQQVYAYKSTIMVAHRSPTTEDIFASRNAQTQIQESADIDLILLYNGGYRLIESNLLMQYKQSILQFIRLQDK